MSRSTLFVLLGIPALTFAESPLAKPASTVPPAAVAVDANAISPWSLSVGVVWRSMGNLRFNSGSHARGYPLPAFDTSDAGPAGSSSSLGGHNYRNGYVYTDITGTASDETWNWGYTDSGQLQGSDLGFQGTAFLYSETMSRAKHPGWDSDMSGAGPVLRVEWAGVQLRPDLRVGAEASISLITANQSHTFRTFSDRRTQYTAAIVDHYTVDPFSIPSAPYSGDAFGPGPLIFSNPDRREVKNLAATNTTIFRDHIHENLDVTLTTLSLGPTVSYSHKRVSVAASLGFALNVASWEADKVDALWRHDNKVATRLARWHDHASGTDVLPGFYLQTSASLAINSAWSAQIFGRYDWSDSLEGRVGPSTFHLDMSGWSAGFALVLKF